MVFGRHTLDGRADTVLSVPHEKERGAASGAGRVGQLRPLDSIRLNGVRPLGVRPEYSAWRWRQHAAVRVG